MLYADSSSVTLTWQFVIIAVCLIAVFFIGKFKGLLLSRMYKASSLAARSLDHSTDKGNSPRLGQDDFEKRTAPQSPTKLRGKE